MKLTILSICAIAMISVLPSCKKSSSAPATTAGVMFVNGTTGTSAVNVSAGGVTVNGGTNIVFQKSSGYQNVTAGSAVTIAYSETSSGATAQLKSASETFAVNGHYSVFSGGIFTNPTIVMAADDLTAPASGNTKVRFVNLSPDNLTVSCFVGLTKVDSNIAPGGYSPFIEMSAVTSKSVTLQDQTSTIVQANINSQTFAAGKIYTVLLTGTSAAGTSGSAVLGLAVINNN